MRARRWQEEEDPLIGCWIERVLQQLWMYAAYLNYVKLVVAYKTNNSKRSVLLHSDERGPTCLKYLLFSNRPCKTLQQDVLHFNQIHSLSRVKC